MSISFYEASVDTYQRVLGSVAGIMDKGAAYAADSGLDLQEIVTTKLRDDMMPFHFQVVSVCHHSWGALQGMREGRFTTPSFDLDKDYQGLQALVSEAQEGVASFSKAMLRNSRTSRWSLRSGIARCRLRIRTSC